MIPSYLSRCQIAEIPVIERHRPVGMEELRQYINSLSLEQRALFEQSCGTTIGYLRKAISVGTRLDGALARKIDEASFGKVRKEVLRPDVWPELVVAA